MSEETQHQDASEIVILLYNVHIICSLFVKDDSLYTCVEDANIVYCIIYRIDASIVHV